MPRTALLLGAAIVGTVTTFSAWTGGSGLGIDRAEAAQHYTRKKGSGRWGSGKVAKGSVKRGAGRVRFTTRGRFVQPSRRAAVPVAAPVSPQPQAQPAPAADAVVASATPPERLTELASLPAVASPPPASPPAAPAPEATTGSIAPASERVISRSSDLPPPDRVIATASIGLLQPTPGLERMRSGLEARARSIRAETDALTLPLPENTPPVRMVAKSVTFDLARGERTIVFEDGQTITAPFDRSRAADLTGFQAASR